MLMGKESFAEKIEKGRTQPTVSLQPVTSRLILSLLAAGVAEQPALKRCTAFRKAKRVVRSGTVSLVANLALCECGRIMPLV